VFTLMASSMIAALVGLSLIAPAQAGVVEPASLRPYIALAATVWIFWGESIRDFFLP